MHNEGFRMVVVLALISLVSAVVLAQFYGWAEPVIATNKEIELQKAILEVLPEAQNFEAFAANFDGSNLKIYRGIGENGEDAGIAFLAEGPGFQGMITVMVGMEQNTSRLTGIKILDQLETPGLGARIAEERFTSQFKGKKTSDPFVAKKDVDAVTGATISSSAVSKIVRLGIKEATSVVKEVNGGDV